MLAAGVLAAGVLAAGVLAAGVLAAAAGLRHRAEGDSRPARPPDDGNAELNDRRMTASLDVISVKVPGLQAGRLLSKLTWPAFP